VTHVVVASHERARNRFFFFLSRSTRVLGAATVLVRVGCVGTTKRMRFARGRSPPVAWAIQLLPACEQRQDSNHNRSRVRVSLLLLLLLQVASNELLLCTAPRVLNYCNRVDLSTSSCLKEVGKPVSRSI
jgi:hypothetical protein